jgi:hypothetical protein
MPEQISWTFDVQVAKGPKISASRIIKLEAYDKIEVLVPKKEGDTPGSATVEVQPSAAALVQFILIGSSQYDSKLSYKVNQESTDSIELDAPQLFVGNGAIKLLGPEGPKKLSSSPVNWRTRLPYKSLSAEMLPRRLAIAARW